MAALAKCQRSYYAGAESKNELPLLEKQADNLQRHLGFDTVWFAGAADRQPIISSRLLLINMDWGSRLLGVTSNVRSSRINIAENAVSLYLPKLLADAGVVACRRAEAPGGGRMILFVLNPEEPQGLILCADTDQNICTSVEKIAAPHVIDSKPIVITDNDFAAATSFSEIALDGFLKQCGLAEDAAETFRNALAHAEQQHFDYDKRFGKNAREIALRRILQDMQKHGITISELTEAQSK
jgi:hypothetical protein